MAYPHTFGGLSGIVPLSYLDDNFSAAAQSGSNSDITALNSLTSTPTILAVAAGGTIFSPTALAVGQNANNNGQGLQIGGGNTTYGANGVTLAPDGNFSWLRFQPSKNESSIELNIYPSASQGRATANIGTSQITRISGTLFSASWVGKRFYLGTTAYLVATFIDVSNITVTFLAGDKTVPFAASFNETFHVCYVSGTGTCNVVGTTVTRISGDPFISFIAAPFVLNINGTPRAVASFSDINTYTLGAAPGNLSGATYEFETTVNDQISTLRIQKLLGTDEENLSLFTNYFGHQIRSLYAGNGLERTIYIGTATKNHLCCFANGDLTIGATYGSEAIRVLYSGTGVNRLQTQAANTGVNPGIAGRGSDADVGIGLDTQAAGSFIFTSHSYGNTEFQVFGDAGNDWLTVGSVTGKAVLSCAGTSADVDIQIAPKGSGRIWVGPWSANVDAAVNGYITIKDSLGNVRKLATIA